MASSGVGRGRGRGRGGVLAFVETKPGGDTKENEQDILATMIRSLAIEPDNIELMPVSDAAKRYCKSKGEIESLVNMLYTRCTKDWKFARCATQVCLSIMDIQAQHESFRTILLQTIQKDFKVKDELRSENPPKFLGCLSFLCQVFATNRDANQDIFKVLIEPVVASLSMLLDQKATNEEISCASFHLVDVCPLLHKHCDKSVVIQLLNTVKDMIVSNRGTKESRYQLIFVVEKFALLRATVPT